MYVRQLVALAEAAHTEQLSLVPRPPTQPRSQATYSASFPGHLLSLVPRPPTQPRSQATYSASFPGHLLSLVPRPPTQPRSQATYSASFPGHLLSLVPRPPTQPRSQATYVLSLDPRHAGSTPKEDMSTQLTLAVFPQSEEVRRGGGGWGAGRWEDVGFQEIKVNWRK